MPPSGVRVTPASLQGAEERKRKWRTEGGDGTGGGTMSRARLGKKRWVRATKEKREKNGIRSNEHVRGKGERGS